MSSEKCSIDLDALVAQCSEKQVVFSLTLHKYGLEVQCKGRAVSAVVQTVVILCSDYCL